MRIDLNADIGEASDPAVAHNELALLDHVTSVNIACGLHAGNPVLMRLTAETAHQRGVAVGAHPGFFDPEHLGRREQALSPADVRTLVLYQVGALAAIAGAAGVRLRHVKPHGALYNMAARDPSLAAAVADAVYTFDPTLMLVGLSGSALTFAGQRAGLSIAHEAFVDRAYMPDGTLVPRNEAGAVLTDLPAVVLQAVRLATTGTVVARGGVVVTLRVDSLCLHGDTPGALGVAAHVHRALRDAGVTLAPVERPEAARRL